jgi:hypothetical protein
VTEQLNAGRSKTHCPRCGPATFSEVVAEFRSVEESAHEWFQTDFRTLRCCGCETIYFQRESKSSTDETYETDPETGQICSYYPGEVLYYPPRLKREHPEWSSQLMAVDPDLYHLFSDIYTALNNDLNILAAIGIRTAFDRATELLSIDPKKSFVAKLDELVATGRIGSAEKEFLDILTDAGSAAAHRSWRPGDKDLGTMMTLIESFIHRTFLLSDAAKELKTKVPPRLP